MKGDIVYAPDGERIALVDIGLVKLLDNPVVTVWDVSLEPDVQHPWHLHHNPYVVLSVHGSDGRMDWLDGSPPRFISEYRGGAVYRPVSPVHRLTNIGGHFYQNRLIELKDFGELLAAPFDIGAGDRSIEGERPGVDLPDGRKPVIDHAHVRVWMLALEPGETADVELTGLPHVVATLDPPALDDDPNGGIVFHEGGSCHFSNDESTEQSWFLVELRYLDNLDSILSQPGGDT